MPLSKYEFLYDDWTVEGEEGNTFLSPSLDRHWEQIVLFPGHEDRNYSVEVDLTLLKGQVFNNIQYNEAGIIFRYNGPDQYYYAGVGGFTARVFIGMVEKRGDQSGWNRLASLGRKDQLPFEALTKLRVECRGTQLTLIENDQVRLSVEDDTYTDGYWGLRTVRTQARFQSVAIADPGKPHCFVIMPFSTSLAFVYEVIKEVVTREGIECLRADESAVAQPIVEEVKDQIMNADLVIADITGRNPNVYYEAGFAHALGKKVILIAQSEADLAFDLRGIRTVLYAEPRELRRRLVRAIKDTFLRGSVR
jgi:hypothetical protein